MYSSLLGPWRFGKPGSILQGHGLVNERDPSIFCDFFSSFFSQHRPAFLLLLPFLSPQWHSVATWALRCAVEVISINRENLLQPSIMCWVTLWKMLGCHGGGSPLNPTSLLSVLCLPACGPLTSFSWIPGSPSIPEQTLGKWNLFIPLFLESLCTFPHFFWFFFQRPIQPGYFAFHTVSWNSCKYIFFHLATSAKKVSCSLVMVLMEIISPGSGWGKDNKLCPTVASGLPYPTLLPP